MTSKRCDALRTTRFTVLRWETLILTQIISSFTSCSTESLFHIHTKTFSLLQWDEFYKLTWKQSGATSPSTYFWPLEGSKSVFSAESSVSHVTGSLSAVRFEESAVPTDGRRPTQRQVEGGASAARVIGHLAVTNVTDRTFQTLANNQDLSHKCDF